jgi:diaminopimelate decarboxylase
MASNYNLVPRPALVLLRRGESHLIQRRESWDDLAARDLPWPEDDHVS